MPRLQRPSVRRRSLSLFSFLLAFLSHANFIHAEQTRFDLAQLKAPPGFHISVFAQEVDGARMLVFTPGGVLLASESGGDKVVALPDPKRTGKAARTVTCLLD